MNGSSPNARRASNALLQTALVVAVLATWEVCSRVFPSPALPSVSSVGESYVDLLHGQPFMDGALPSITRVTLGFLAGVIGGAIVGLAIGFAAGLEPWVRPVLEFLRAIPTVALLPAAVLLLGPTDTMRITVIAVGCAFPVLLAAIDGARRVDRQFVDAARIAGLSKGKILLRVVTPAALPQLFAGIRIALGLALIMMVISELMAADDGIGFFIQQNQRLFRTVDVYAGVLLIGTIGLIFTSLLLALERRLLYWHRGWMRGAET